MNRFFILLMLMCSLCACGQQTPKPMSICNGQVPFGVPHSHITETTLICRSAYLLEHDNKAKIPVWVSYVLTPEHAVGCVIRSNAFASDITLPIGKRSELKDYAKSGYDIGHQANDGDMAWSVQTERESFILSNMAPQLPGFNRGIWKKLEDQVRAWSVGRDDSLLIYVGPIYSDKDSTLGRNDVIIPHAFYKIVIDTKTSEVMVFEFAHRAAQGNLTQFMTTLSQVEKDTGIVFPMPKSPQFSDKMWSSNTKSARKAKRGVCSI